MQFEVDDRIHTSAFWLGDWPLSAVYLKNHADFRWLILVPRIANAQEIYQLSIIERHLLMDEMVALSAMMEALFKPDKINMGALGNMVSQLHVHVVARFKTDVLWPHGIWQPDLIANPYDAEEANGLVKILRKKIEEVSVTS